MTLSENGIAIIKEFEGFRESPYLDSVNVPTIGYGTTVYPNDTRVKITDRDITEAQAIEYLKDHVNKHIAPYMPLLLNQNQFDALVSFIYNLGIGKFNSSTLKKKVIANAPCDEIQAEFNKWTKAGGKALNGLVKRRAKEAELFCKPIELNTDKP